MVLERLYGRHAVEAALKANRRKLIKLSVSYPVPTGRGQRQTAEQVEVGRLMARAREIGIPVEHATRSWLDDMAGDRPHQNVILTVHPLPINDLSPSELGPGTFVMLDGLQDPQNIGAIMRSSYFLGASGVLLRNM